MKKLLRLSHHGEKGFTLIELLIVIAILGIIAAVVIPNLATFLESGKLNAARTEAENVKTVALAFYADNDGNWPDTSTDLYTTFEGGTGDVDYLNAKPIGTYDFDPDGRIQTGTYGDTGFTWNYDKQTWER